ncbi:GNAT family N-acetyltransferase [Hymenobacter crusticola]|uniref:N-acetyltransferase domain-containing protein n=1 Tax=Hymenobacter crusticola TaxID=1770526 RepID=A0A243WGB4_9BACT|nr:GNAT family N-acetyltransferase [Hymenobacter crusticola]OUJ74816.1 hypothetical protein BXP70_08665 [Hymenobacter crusticola]
MLACCIRSKHGVKLVGFLLGFHRADALQPRYFISQLNYRGLSLGKKLMQKFLAFMYAKHDQEPYLWTAREQRTAIALHHRCGFQLTEEKNSVAFDKELVEQRYDLLLTASRGF